MFDLSNLIEKARAALRRLPGWAQPQDPVLRLYLSIFMGAVVVLALIGVLTTSPLPDRVRQEQKLVEHSHTAGFDYAVHLQPSTLNGINPVSAYPAAIVSDMAFSYTYQQAERETETVSVYAVMENPGIWRKNIPLVPESQIEGDFTVEFSLDMTSIMAQFIQIEEELKLKNSQRNLTVYANVKSSKGTFTQALPLKLSDTIVEVSNDLTYRRLWCAGIFKYTVNMAPSSAFDTQTIDSPVFDSSLTTLRPGLAVPARLAQGMEASLDYRFNASKEVQELASTVEISTILQTDKLGNRTFPVMSAVRKGDFKLYFPVDLGALLRTLDAAGMETGVNADDSTLTISARIHTTGNTEHGPIDEVFTPVLKGVIKGNLITWESELSKTQTGAITETRQVPNPGRYMGLSAAGIQALTRVLLGISLVLLAYLMFWKPAYRTEPGYQPGRENARIQKKYRSRIVETLPGSYDNTVKPILLGTFDDLLKVSDELGKPILHRAMGTMGRYDSYFVTDGDTFYIYIVNESDAEGFAGGFAGGGGMAADEGFVSHGSGGFDGGFRERSDGGFTGGFAAEGGLAADGGLEASEEGGAASSDEPHPAG